MSCSIDISVCARDSNLSKAQVKEVLSELLKFHQEVRFETTFLKSTGDRDKKTSLRALEKTDFFTKELDALILAKKHRLAIHSAKDLPDPLPKRLCVAAITGGVDAADSLVLSSQKPMPATPLIATSSLRREEMVKEVLPQALFVDIRGTIEERLAILEQGKIDGVVVAEAALIRLDLVDLPRLRLPGETTPLQGRLALITHVEDSEVQNWVAPLHRSCIAPW